MSTAAVSSNSIYQELQTWYQARNSDLQQLSQALQSGDLAGAQQEYQAIVTLGQSGPFANGDPFWMRSREQDFQAIGQALQAGDLAGAQQAFAELKSTVHHREPPVAEPASGGPITPPLPPSGQPVAGTGSTGSNPMSVGPEIILNLGSVSPGEQITIGLSNAGNGGEQVTIGIAGQQGQTPEQITLNLNPNTNEQIVLNLLNSAAATPAQTGSVNVTA